jgi:hypothetical protein
MAPPNTSHIRPPVVIPEAPTDTEAQLATNAECDRWRWHADAQACYRQRHVFSIYLSVVRTQNMVAGTWRRPDPRQASEWFCLQIHNLKNLSVPCYPLGDKNKSPMYCWQISYHPAFVLDGCPLARQQLPLGVSAHYSAHPLQQF